LCFWLKPDWVLPGWVVGGYVAVAILDQASQAFCRCWRPVSLLFFFAAVAGVTGTGWRKRPWSAVVARRARCSKTGYCYYSGIGSAGLTEGFHNISHCSSVRDSHNAGKESVSKAVDALVSPPIICKVSESKAEGTSGEWLKLTRIPRLSAWADADDEAWPHLVNIDTPAAEVEVSSVQECKEVVSCAGGGASSLVDTGAVELPLAEVLTSSLLP